MIRPGTVGLAAYNLPAGYRPVDRLALVAISGTDVARVDIDPNGDVIPISPAGLTSISLCGPSFKSA